MLKNKAQFYQCFGIQCWYTYSSNPKEIDLYISKDGANFVTWANFHLKYVDGYQFFNIHPIGERYNYLKCIIKDTFGSNQTYWNQILLWEENPNADIPVKLPKQPISNSYDLNKLSYIQELEEWDVGESSKPSSFAARSPLKYWETDNGTMTARELFASEHILSKKESVRVSIEDPEASANSSHSSFLATNFK